MTDHPNQFPVGTAVLFRSRAKYGNNQTWTAGTIVAVRMADREDTRREYDSSSQWEATMRSDTKHAADCEWVYYDVLPESVRYDMRYTHVKRLLCQCADEIVAADDSHRWTGQTITERSEYLLLQADMDRAGRGLAAYAEVDGLVQLISGTKCYAVATLDHLLAWASGDQPGGDA